MASGGILSAKAWFHQLTDFLRNRTASEGVQGRMGAIGTDKRQGRALVSIAAAIIAVLTTTAGAQRRLQMEVEVVPPDPSREIIGTLASKTYIGRLRNTGKSPVLVQVVPIAGRNQGNGIRGACYLEKWDSTSRRWIYSPPPIMSLESASIYSFILRGGDAAEVCGRPSALELAPPGGKRYRFVLQVQMKRSSSPSIISRAFCVGVPAEGKCHRDADVGKAKRAESRGDGCRNISITLVDPVGRSNRWPLGKEF